MVVFLELFQETNWSILKLEVTVLRPKNLLSQKINGNIIRNGNIRRFFRVTIQPWTLKMKRLFRNEKLTILSVVTYWSEIDLAPIPVSKMLLNVFYWWIAYQGNNLSCPEIPAAMFKVCTTFHLINSFIMPETTISKMKLLRQGIRENTLKRVPQHRRRTYLFLTYWHNDYGVLMRSHFPMKCNTGSTTHYAYSQNIDFLTVLSSLAR